MAQPVTPPPMTTTLAWLSIFLLVGPSVARLSQRFDQFLGLGLGQRRQRRTRRAPARIAEAMGNGGLECGNQGDLLEDAPDPRDALIALAAIDQPADVADLVVRGGADAAGSPSGQPLNDESFRGREDGEIGEFLEEARGGFPASRAILQARDHR